jgi:hypothetical protein
MPKWIVAVVFGLLIFWSGGAQAQAPVSLAKLEVDLWPEYDRPDMLVVYHMFLDPGTALPANLVVSVPAAAGDPAAVAVRNADGQLYNVAYNRVVNGDVAQISFSASALEIQFEYYDPGLAKNGPIRSFNYRWPGIYAVKSFSVQVQQPSGASNMQITPSLGSGVPGEGGLMYFSSNLGAVSTQELITVSLTYQKSTNNLSVEKGKVGPSAPVNGATPGRAAIGTVWVYVFGGVALLMIGSGGVWYWRSAHQTAAPMRRRHTSYRESVTQPSQEQQLYCHQCGKKASAGDVFCRSCGMRLRRD